MSAPSWVWCRPRSWPCTRRPSTRSRDTPSRWTTKCASTASECCWSSRATPTLLDANAVAVDEPLALYARRREAFDVLTAAAVRAGDEPSVVSQVIVAAATDTRPRLRYPAGTLARRVSKLRRYVPPAIFDKQIRKTSQLAAWAQGGRPQPPQVRALGTAGPSHPGRRRSSTGSATWRRR